MTLKVFNTHIEIYPYKKGDYPVIEDMYTVEDHYTKEEVPCGYIIEDKKLYLPRGTPVSKLEFILDIKAKYDKTNDPIENMSRKHHSFYDPRDNLQENSIKFLTETSNHQLGLNLMTGKGKTFCVAYSSTLLNERTLIITPNEGLKSQWMKTYTTMFDYKEREICNIHGSSVMDAIVADMMSKSFDIYFVNHQTIRSYLTSRGPASLQNFFKKINVGIKVYDESHQEFGNILLIDSFSNTNRTWYLTATFDRSSKEESRCFKRAFSTVETFGEMESKNSEEKHVIYHPVYVNSRIDPFMRRKIIGYQGLTAAKYGRYAFFDDPRDTMYEAVKIIIEKVKHVEGKMLIFIPLIDAVDKIAGKLKEDFPDKTIGVYHSRVSNDEKESALKKDIIISTIKSCGTGKDIPRLRTVICCEPMASKVMAEQVIGRLRPYEKDKDTYYFDMIDICIPPIIWWFRSRIKKIQTLVKSTVYLNIDG